MSLNRKATAVLVVASIALAFISSTVFFTLDSRDSARQFEDDLVRKAHLIAEDISTALVFLQQQQVSDAVDRAMRDESIQGLVVTDSNNAPFEQRMRNGFDAQYLAEDPDSVSEGDYANVSVAINYNGQAVGLLTLIYDYSGNRVSSSQYLRLLLTFLVSSLMITTFILLLVHWYTTRPIMKLASFARRISLLNEYDKRFPHTGSTDEIGTLTSAINDMLDTINEGQQKLEKHAGELESLVELRTEQLNRRANFDQLTGLPNRYQLMDQMQRLIEQANTLNQRLAVVLFDLDRFKNINDSMGHHAGDLLLQEVSRRVGESLTNGEFFARLGGDEFVVVISNLKSESIAIGVAERMLKVISDDIRVENLDLRTSASMGISIFPEHAKTRSELLKCADISMYHSKETGRAGYSVYTSMMATHTRRLQLEAALGKALDRGEFELVYQPQVEFFSGRIAGFEALLRWNNKELGNPTPDEFIPIAAESAYIHDITRWVVDSAARDISVIQSMGLESASVAINILPDTLNLEGFGAWLTNAMEKNGLKPGSIEIEINEDIFLSSADQGFDLLKDIQLSGIRIAIDDFGTRYSSLLHLVGFPLDTIKIDRQFISGLETSNKHRNVVSAIISLAHGLGLRVIAEGVELDSQRQFLRAQGCDLMQGNLVQRPENCRDLLKTISPSRKTDRVVTRFPNSGQASKSG